MNMPGCQKANAAAPQTATHQIRIRIGKQL